MLVECFTLFVGKNAFSILVRVTIYFLLYHNWGFVMLRYLIILVLKTFPFWCYGEISLELMVWLNKWSIRELMYQSHILVSSFWVSTNFPILCLIYILLASGAEQATDIVVNYIGVWCTYLVCQTVVILVRSWINILR